MVRFRTILIRSCRLLCPVCGKAKLFEGWFSMRESCPVCEVQFERESGFLLGSIYINYGLTALVVAVAYPALLFNGVLGERALMSLALGFAILFPIWFFRYARSLWIGIDQFCDPRDTNEQDPTARRPADQESKPTD